MKNVAEEWYGRIVMAQHGHNLAALRFSGLHFWIGMPVIGLTALVGTSVFASLALSPNKWIVLTIGTLSVAATVLAAIQTFLSYNERAEKHRMTAARYGALGRKFELLLKAGNYSSLNDLREQIDVLAQECPNIPRAVHKDMKNYQPRWQGQTIQFSNQPPGQIAVTE